MELNTVGLSNTMFTDFQAPGFILFFAVGILTLLAAILTMMKNPYYATFTFLQGAILTGWILAPSLSTSSNSLFAIDLFVAGSNVNAIG
ncbi:MAG: hypothetical protein U5K54_10070 [Cytophagales bacterium]|nr:hypothetical protein [Cytophagales bacterium]